MIIEDRVIVPDGRVGKIIHCVIGTGICLILFDDGTQEVYHLDQLKTYED